MTYLEIDPAFGTWEDIRSIGEHTDILVDLMVNHISQQSPYFQDFLLKGRASEYADLFLTLDKVWTDGVPVQKDIDQMFCVVRYPTLRLKSMRAAKRRRYGQRLAKQTPQSRLIWIYVRRSHSNCCVHFENFKSNNVKIVRLDAVGYVIKKLGTSCFFVEPDIYVFLDWVKSLADELEIELLPEVHAHYSVQYKLADFGCWIYDFILPYRVLETLVNRSSRELRHYLADRPANQFTMLDCHDGIPVKPDLDGLIRTDEAQRLVDICLERGANLSLILSDKHKSEDGFNVHQIRCTYYSALNEDDDAYLAARAIQFLYQAFPRSIMSDCSPGRMILHG